MHKISKEERKFVKSLTLKKFRNLHKQFLVEGIKPVKEAVNNIKEALVKVYCVEKLSTEFSDLEHLLVIVSENDLKTISNLKNPQGVIAICNFYEAKATNGNLILALDNVQDPGNMGAIIRSADWFGVKELWCSKDCVDIYNPKVIQATMGAIFRVKVRYTDLASAFAAIDIPIYGAFLEGTNFYTTTLEQSCVLVMGNEGNGISEEIEALVTDKITIPRIGDSESLNVSIATSVLLSEFTRRTF